MDRDCQQCKGNGHHRAHIMNHGTHQYEWHTVPCDNPTCKNGKVDPEAVRREHLRNTKFTTEE